MKTGQKKSDKLLRVKKETDLGQIEPNNMLVKKSVLNEINKEGTFTQGFKDSRKIKRTTYQNLENL